MKKLFALVFLLISLSTFSQKKKKTHSIELLPNDTESVENVDFYISKIIDNRIYKDNIGIAQKGPFNKKVLSEFNKEFDVEILDYLNTVFPVDSTKKALTIRINQLLISEVTGALKETGKAVVNLDVLLENNGEYGLLGSYSSFAEKNSMDVTGKHDDRIRQVLKDCLMQFSASTWKDKKPITISLERSEAPLILSEPVNKGFFTSFQELYNNQSFVDSLITFKENTKHADRLMLEDRVHKRALYYAYSDGKDIYLNAANYSGEKHFVKTMPIDRFLLFNDTFVHQDEVGAMSLAFGVLGVLASNRNTNVLMDLYTGQYHTIHTANLYKSIKQKYPELSKKLKDNSKDVEVVKSVLTQLFEKEDNKDALRRFLISNQ